MPYPETLQLTIETLYPLCHTIIPKELLPYRYEL